MTPAIITTASTLARRFALVAGFSLLIGVWVGFEISRHIYTWPESVPMALIRLGENHFCTAWGGVKLVRRTGLDRWTFLCNLDNATFQDVAVEVK